MNILRKLSHYFNKSPNSMQKYSQEELKNRLTPLQYQVTQLSGTEPPYKSTSNTIQISTIKQKTLEPTTVLCVLVLFSLPTSNTTVDADGQLFMMN